MKIRLYAHPFLVVEPEVYESDSLARWLLDHYGDSPRVNVQIFRGEPCAANDISRNLDAILCGDCEEYVILESPGAPIYYLYAVVVVLMIAAIVLTPKPKLPGDVNRTQESANNSLTNRENQLRTMERVEDIYGTVLSVPSLMMPAYNKYHNHRKYEYGYYCVGRGYYDISEVRDGDTLLADIDGSSAAVYAPFTSPNSGHAAQVQIGDPIIDPILTVSRSVEVDGITLKAPNQVQLPASATYTLTPDVAGGIIAQAAKTPNFNAVVSVGDVLSVVMGDYVSVHAPVTVEGVPESVMASVDTFSGIAFTDIRVGDPVVVAGFLGEENNGTFTVVEKPYSTAIRVSVSTLVEETSSACSFTIARNYTGDYTVAAVEDGWIRVPPAESSGWLSPIRSHPCAAQIDGVTEYSDWVTLPAPDRTEVWCNILAQQGLYKDDGGKSVASVAFALEIEKLDSGLVPLGIVETATGTTSGAVSDERAETLEHVTSWTGPARVRMRRTTPYDYGFAGTVIDEIKWADLYSVSPVGRAEFGNKTTIHTITQATERATATKSRQLNCIASRKIPTYDGVGFSGAFDADGRHVSGTISATSKIVDILAAVSVDPKIGARDLATEVDMAQIYGVQQTLNAWNPECGQFNYTFDSDNISFEETVTTIANAGFCIAYRQNGKIRLAADIAQPASTALFTHRNKKPQSETITRKFSSDSEYDGVEFVYVDPDSQQSETIVLPLDGNYTKLKKFEIAGIRSFPQAWLRANREYRKLIGQRVTIETTTTLDARSLLPNSRVDIVDNTRFKSYDGEVVAQTGLEITLSRDVAFTPGQPHSVVLMKRDGTVEGIPCTEGSTANRVVLAHAPAEAIVTIPGADGIRTIFSFASDSSRAAMAYSVNELRPDGGQYVTIVGQNYSPDFYAMDDEPIPPRDTVIN